METGHWCSELIDLEVERVQDVNTDAKWMRSAWTLQRSYVSQAILDAGTLFRLRRLDGRWHTRIDPDTLRVGCVHLAATVLPATLWTAAITSRWCVHLSTCCTRPALLVCQACLYVCL